MHILHDLRYAFRTLRRSAGLTLVIVLSLGIGIGANSAIFSVVNALLLKPLPYPEPERLVVLWLRSPASTFRRTGLRQAVHRRPDRESLVRHRVDLAGAERHAARRTPAEGSRRC
jgi:hypothetical protein